MAILWLADVLRAAGVQVVEEGNWRARGVSGSFDPIGVLWHHTAATSSPSNPAPALSVCINGRSDLQGPLCHALVDYHGVFHIISANRANHAGTARASGPIPAGDGNRMLIGWEIDYNGVNQSMTAAQYNASVAATAAVLRMLGRDASFARGHRETSTTGKIDPSFIDLNVMRADVARAMSGPPGPVAGPMYHRIRNAEGTGWSNFAPLAGAGTTAHGSAFDVAIAGMTDGSAQALIVGADGGFYHQVRSRAGEWSGFLPLMGGDGSQVAKGSRVSIAGMPDGSAQVAVVGADGGLYHRIRNAEGTGWSNFAPLMGGDGTQHAKGSDVAITATPDGSAHLLIVGADGGFYHQVRSRAGEWSGFLPLMGGDGSQVAKGSRVSIAGMPDGSVQVAVVGADGGLYHRIRNAEGTGWSNFLPLMGGDGTQHAKGSDVSIAAMPDGSAQLLIVGADGGFYHRIRDAAGTGWSDFLPLMGGDGTQMARGQQVSIAGMPDGSAHVIVVGQ